MLKPSPILPPKRYVWTIRGHSCSVFICRYSQFQDEYSLEDIMKSPKIHDPLTKLQCWYVS